MNKENKKTNTRDVLIDATIRILSIRPKASLAEVAAEAGVQRMTLNRLIGTKQDLLREMALRSLEEIDEVSEEAARNAKSHMDALRNIVEAVIPLGHRWHFMWTQSDIWQVPEVAKEIERQESELFELLDLAKKEGTLRRDLPNAWISASIDAAIYAALSTAQSQGLALEDLSSLASSSLFEGMASSSHKKTGKLQRKSK